MPHLEKPVGTDPIKGWVYIPAHEGGVYLVDEYFIASRLVAAINMAIGAAANNEMLREVARQRGLDGESVERMLASQTDLSNWALRARTGGYPTVYNHAFIAMWGAFDVAIENTIVEILKRDQVAVAAISEVLAPQIRVDPNGPLDEAEARGVYVPLRTKANKKGRPISGLRILFGWCGVTLSVADDTLEVLIEAVNARNVLVHRYGALDNNTRSQFPWISPTLEELVITKDLFDRYYGAMAGFLGGLVLDLGKSRHAA